MKLYELTEQYIGLSHLIDEGELDAETLQATLDGLSGDLEAKAEGLLSYIGNIGSDVSAIDTEIKRLQARKKTMTNRQDSLREYLKFNMMVGDIQKIACPLFTITLTKPRPMVVVDDEDAIPVKFKLEIPASYKLVKADLLRALKQGKIDGAHLGESQPGLRIT